ncbi:fimbrial protein [Stenotrophomonas sp. CFBP 13725]|uniref:fimbrial protein n=1 Tax=Stenotrophomonas sp. CFBP 13725 TaxID=2775297 RepID=UPI0017831DC1|nr:fimbrial protein [Stenotrophomonas sp. CFBP 13725]MBD8634636.1 fimbrial protein [Stenotrophomonas sp. CFBP 13725]
MPLATAFSLPTLGPPMNLVVLASDRDLLPRLAAKLPPNWTLGHHDAGFPGAVQQLRVGAQTLVLLDFHAARAAASAELVRQLRQIRPDLSMVAVGATSLGQIEGVVSALRAGLRDFVDLDADAEEILAVLTRAAIAPAPPTPEVARKAPLTLLLGVRAGMGSSTLAAHLSVLAQQMRAAGNHQDVLLLDMSQPAGDLALYLNIDSRFHYDEALRSAARIDATLARTAMARHPGGLVLLDRAAGSEALPPSDPGLLLQRLRSLFCSVLCDLGGTPLRQVPGTLLDNADEIWLVTDSAIASLVSLDQLLHQLPAGLRGSDRLKLIVNRDGEHNGLTAAQIATRFALPLLATLPDRPRLRASASQGHLLLDDAPRDPYVRALAPLLARFDPTTSPPEAQGLRDRFAHALSNLPWKTK